MVITDGVVSNVVKIDGDPRGDDKPDGDPRDDDRRGDGRTV